MEPSNTSDNSHIFNRLAPLIILFLLLAGTAFSQEYGLAFKGQPHSKDRRTQLDLNPGAYFAFSGEFELSFLLRIRKDSLTAYGYVCRIIDEHGNNVDLLFNGPKRNSLQVVHGDVFSSIIVPDPDSGLYKAWKEIRMTFNLKDQALVFSTPDTTLMEQKVPLSGKVRIFFGRNTFDPVQTTDVPTMDVKDIRITRNGKLSHHFPLDELTGDYADDRLSGKKALVQNPMWIRHEYYQWDPYFSTYLQGFATSCFSAGEDRLFLVGDRQMKVLSLRTNSRENLEYNSTFTGLSPASKVFYDDDHEQLYCYNHRDRTVFRFDFTERKWLELTSGPISFQRLWFHNSYYESPDSTLYVIGGYSQHRYSNQVITYDFGVGQWDTLQTDSDSFHPRMHAAIGSLGDTLYIMGGYGTTTGDQELNPHHYSDLHAFALKDHTFVKKYDFEAPIDDIDFAHSMVFDPNGEDYYVLASTIYQYETHLQLLRGTLSGPKLTAMGTRIPYLFHNENSYADLYFSHSLGILVASSSLANRETGETHIELYTLAYPPFPSEMARPDSPSKAGKMGWILLLALLGAGGLIYLLRGFRKKGRNAPANAEPKEDSGIASAEQAPDPLYTLNGAKDKNSFYFFGGFQVINGHNEDITRKFTPLLKELFLLIFLYSVKNKGVSVPRLTELLWFSMDIKSAKNNRAVNIAKLKHLLNEIECCSISRKTEYWRIVLDDTMVYSDYLIFHKLTSQGEKLSEEDLETLLSVVSAGPLLGNASYEWLDEFKLDCSNRITDVLIKYLEQEKISSNPELSLRIADAILIYDIMHEEGIAIKCKALTELGKHSLAKEIFTKFAKDFQTLYDEPYGKSFTDIIKH